MRKHFLARKYSIVTNIFETYVLNQYVISNKHILGRCEASWGEPERDMTISTRLSDSVFTETHGLENALKSEYE